MTIALQFAMAGEAAPFLARAGLAPLGADEAYGFALHGGRIGATEVVVGVAGSHPRFGVDAIGTVPAALLTDVLVRRFRPRRLINAGTAGGFEARGGAVGDVYLGAEVAVFHDRRIPLGGGFEAMGQGHFPVECDRALAAELGLAVGIVSTGDSLDCTPEDLARMTALGASLKDMEAAAIAWVCERHRVPLVLVKSITDIVDHPADTAAQFTANYALAVDRLAAALARLLPRLVAG